MLNESLFKSDKDDWETPHAFFDRLNEEFHFDLDPCCSESSAKCAKFYTIEDDGLSKCWGGNVFMNPPYGRVISTWVEKAFNESENNGATVVCLVPARTDTRWWHTFCMRSSEIRLLNKRLSFIGGDNKATFPAAIVIFRQGMNSPVLRVQEV